MRAWLVPAVIALEAMLLAVVADRHGVNADEGFYWAAGRHVLEGRRLYADVFYPQMPYLPWAESLLFSLFGPSLAVGRALCVAAGALGAGVLAAVIERQERALPVTIAVCALYGASGVLLNTLAITKTYALSNLGLLVAFGLLTVGPAQRPGWAFAAGLAAAAAIGVRLAVAPAAVLFAFLAWRRGIGAAVGFAAGGLVGSLPWLLVAWGHPEEFWFCNVTFHQLRREISAPAVIVVQKLAVLAKWLLVPQHILLWALALFGLLRAPARVWPAAVTAAVLASAYLLATPTYLEYTAQFLPFVLVMAAPALSWLLARRIAAAAVFAAYVLALYPFIRSVPAENALAGKRELWSRETVRQVTRLVRAETVPSEPILSWWEGYPVLSGRPELIGVGFWESNVARKISADEAQRFHVLQSDDLRALIARRVPGAVVVPEGVWNHLRADISAAGYRPAHRVGVVEIYLR